MVAHGFNVLPSRSSNGLSGTDPCPVRGHCVHQELVSSQI
jgi:hypothetical protein